MTQSDDNLDELLELASSKEERARLRRLWDELGALPSRAETGSAAPADSRFEPVARAEAAPLQAARRRRLQAAAIFAAGLLTGALAALLAPQPPDSDTVKLSPIAARAALSPSPSAAERLVAIKTIGDQAGSRSWVRDSLLDRALLDPTPGVQLAALAALEELDLETAQAARLAQELPGLPPIVQIATIDLLERDHAVALEPVLDGLATATTTETLVRRHAQRAIRLIRQRSTT